ncbi:MAG: hypothetical protein HGA44_04080 [Cellulomonadaceae bacterium]|nr:hypothetical protein [Cellulomonadaceae bacterium]
METIRLAYEEGLVYPGYVGLEEVEAELVRDEQEVLAELRVHAKRSVPEVVPQQTRLRRPRPRRACDRLSRTRASDYAQIRVARRSASEVLLDPIDDRTPSLPEVADEPLPLGGLATESELLILGREVQHLALDSHNTKARKCGDDALKLLALHRLATLKLHDEAPAVSCMTVCACEVHEHVKEALRAATRVG